MARQPFLPAFEHLQYAVGALVLNNRPELTSAIGSCIAIWSQVDNEMGNLFGILLGTDSEAALEVFLSLRRSANQRDALKSAAKYKLVGEDNQFFEALMIVYASLEKERNCLAHGCFGVAANDPSVLLWIDIKDHVHFQTDILARLDRGDSIPDPHKRLKEHMYVYRKCDLAGIQEDMEQCWNAARHFNAYIRNRSGSGQLTEFKRSQSFPLIKAAIVQLEHKKSSVSVPECQLSRTSNGS